ncbi:hypothetical protein [Bacillus sp. MRMR6]|uniref:hypothetical protein n=1 Tax=Bacillus sp. MRMR6 TaxID=1928617 RepID=UPI00158A209B|nr:hypothetical protein [Bacillus sp. MRMR6]
MSLHSQKKEEYLTIINQDEKNQLENSSSNQNSPEFDVSGTALNGLHSLFDD